MYSVLEGADVSVCIVRKRPKDFSYLSGRDRQAFNYIAFIIGMELSDLIDYVTTSPLMNRNTLRAHIYDSTSTAYKRFSFCGIRRPKTHYNPLRC